MKRRLFTLAVVISMLLCIATVTLWVRSYWQYDQVQRWHMDHEIGFWVWTVSSNYGRLTLRFTDNRGWIRTHRTIPDGVHWWYIAGETSGMGIPPGVLGFGCWRDHEVSDEDRPRLRVESTAYDIQVPHWFPTLLLSALPLRWAWLHHRVRRRVSVGLCPTCGYDLRATPDRCPECGTAPAAGA